MTVTSLRSRSAFLLKVENCVALLDRVEEGQFLMIHLLLGYPQRRLTIWTTRLLGKRDIRVLIIVGCLNIFA